MPLFVQINLKVELDTVMELSFLVASHWFIQVILLQAVIYCIACERVTACSDDIHEKDMYAYILKYRMPVLGAVERKGGSKNITTRLTAMWVGEITVCG